MSEKKRINQIAKETGLSEEYIEENEQTINGKLLANFNSQYYNNLSNDDNLFIAESNAIKEIASKGSCIIVGRCADYILKNNDNVFSVFLYNSDESKVNRAVKYYGLNEKYALGEAICKSSWPKYDIAKTVDQEKEIAVQVNGKVRATITININEDEESIKEKALTAENVKNHTAGKEIVKVIIIKGKIVNIVVK